MRTVFALMLLPLIACGPKKGAVEGPLHDVVEALPSERPNLDAPREIHLGQAAVGKIKELTVAFPNNGAEEIDYLETILIQRGELSLTQAPKPVKIKPGETLYVSIKFQPTVKGKSTGSLVMRTRQGALVVPVSGHTPGFGPKKQKAGASAPMMVATKPRPGAPAGATPGGGMSAGAAAALGNSAQTGPLVMKGKYSVEVISEVVGQKRPAMDACYAKEAERAPGLEGKVITRFTIGADGLSKEVFLRSSTFPTGRVEECVLSELHGLRFMSPDGGLEAMISYPFAFPATAPAAPTP
jgi:hypothetical protein